jgi:phospholipid/cholesterol/gamma-HCH transport system substrate-binding protein
MARTSVPPDINSLLDATNTALEAIPRDNLKTVIDESYTAVAGLGPDLSRIVKGSTRLASDARKNLDSLTTLIDQSPPVLDSQAETSDSIQAWAANLANLTGQLRDQDPAVNGLLDKGPKSADEVRQLFERLQPTLPLMLAKSRSPTRTTSSNYWCCCHREPRSWAAESCPIWPPSRTTRVSIWTSI